MLGFLINAALLNFFSSYTIVYFFVKKFIFSNVYILVNTIIECLFLFFGWERGHQLSTYATVTYNFCTEGGVSRLMWWYGKTRVPSYDLRVESLNTRDEFEIASLNPRVMSSNSRVMSSNPWVTSWNPRVTSSNLRVTSSNPRVTRSSLRIIKSMKTQGNNFKSSSFL